MSISQLYTILRMEDVTVDTIVELVSAKCIQDVAHDIEKVYMEPGDKSAQENYPKLWADDRFRIHNYSYGGRYHIIFRKYMISSDMAMDVIVKSKFSENATRYLIQSATLRPIS